MSIMDKSTLEKCIFQNDPTAAYEIILNHCISNGKQPEESKIFIDMSMMVPGMFNQILNYAIDDYIRKNNINKVLDKTGKLIALYE